jgi:hypothetical protein
VDQVAEQPEGRLAGVGVDAKGRVIAVSARLACVECGKEMREEEGIKALRKIEMEHHDGQVFTFNSDSPHLILHGVDKPRSTAAALALRHLEVPVQ